MTSNRCLLVISFLCSLEIISSLNISQCKSNYVFCDGQCVYGNSCLGYYCSTNFDCSHTNNVCCDNVCRESSFNCRTRSCEVNSDCTTNTTCCYGTCIERENCGPITAGVVFGILAVLLFALIAVIGSIVIIWQNRRKVKYIMRNSDPRRVFPSREGLLNSSTQLYPAIDGEPEYQLSPPPLHGCIGYGAVRTPSLAALRVLKTPWIMHVQMISEQQESAEICCTP